MVWKAGSRTLRPCRRGDEASSPSPSSPAEIQVRKIASQIGLGDDSEILATVCHKMRKEYVVEAWQLPALDSRQWEKLHAPIGLAVAVQHISTYGLQEQPQEQQQIQDDVNEDIKEQMQLPVRVENASKKNYEEGKHQKEQALEEKKDDLTSSSRDSPNESPSKQEEKEETETVNISHVDLRSVDEMLEEEGHPLIFIDTASSTETGNGAEEGETIAEKEKDIRKPPLPNATIEFSEDCTDWLQYYANSEENEGVVVAATKEQEQIIISEKNNEKTLTALMEIDGYVDSIGKSSATTTMTTTHAEKKLQAPVEESSDSNGRNSVTTTTTHVEKKLITQFEIKSSDNIGRNSSTPPHLEMKLEAQVDNNSEESPVTSSDSEGEDNNIFSGIGPSTSFPEDEDDGLEKETHNNCLLDPLCTDECDTTADSDTTLLWLHDDDITVAVSNVSPECKKAVSTRTKERNSLKHELTKETSSYVLETAALQDILLNLPDDDHRAILSQLMIMTNARDKVARINLAFQVQDSLLNIIEKHEMEVDSEKAVQLIFHLARLKKSYRVIFGKSLFKAMSKLFKRTEKRKVKISKKEKKQIYFDLEHLAQELSQQKGIIEQQQQQQEEQQENVVTDGIEVKV